MIEKIIVWSLIAYGMTSIIVWGSIFEKLRQWITLKSEFFGSLVTCVLCTSTWVGFFLSICFGGLVSNFFYNDYINHFVNFLSSTNHWFYGVFMVLRRIFIIFFDGAFTAGIVWIINSIVEFFEESRINITKHE